MKVDWRLSVLLRYRQLSYYQMRSKKKIGPTNVFDWFFGILYAFITITGYFVIMTGLFSYAILINMIHRPSKKIRKTAKKYARAYVHLPNAAYYKFLEGQKFKKAVKTGDGCLEIGADKGLTSGLHFSHIKKLFIASELVLDTFKLNKHKFYQNRIVSDATTMPFKDKSIKDIFMVHVIDHIQDMSSVYREIHRVKKDRFIFSGHSSRWLRIFFMYIFSSKRMLKAKKHANSMSNYHFYSKASFNKTVKKLGLKVIEYSEFSKGHLGIVNDILHVFFYKKLAALPWRFGLKIGFKRLMVKLVYYYVLLGYINDQRTGRGVHFFAVIR